MVKYKFLAKLTEKGLQIHDKIGFMEAVKRFGDKGILLEVSPVREWQSDQQRAYYFGVVVYLLAKNSGYTKEEMHEILKRLFLSKEVNIFNKKILIGGSTRLLSKGEFAEYITKCINLATEFGVVIPTPEEYYQKLNVNVVEKSN